MSHARPHEPGEHPRVGGGAIACPFGCAAVEVDAHARIADELAAEVADPGEVGRHRAWHLLRAGSVEDALGVVELLAASNESAGRSDDALADLDIASDAGGLLTGAQHASLLAKSAYAATMSEREDAAFRWQVALAEANASGDDEGEARARYFLHWLGDDSPGSALDHLRLALPLAEQQVGWALDCRALLAAFEGDLERASEDAAGALAAARRSGDRRLELDALNALAYVQHWSGDLDTAVATQEAAARMADAVHDHRAAGIAQLNLALYRFEQLELEAAIDAAERCARTMQARGVDAYSSLGWCTAGMLACLAGRPTEAIDRLPASVLAAAGAGDGVTGLVPTWRTLLSALVLTLGSDDDEVVDAAIGSAERGAQETGDGFVAALAALCRVRRAAQLGDVEAAVTHAELIDPHEPIPALLCAVQLARLGALLDEPRLVANARQLVADIGARESRLARLVGDEVRAISDPTSASGRGYDALPRRWAAAGMVGDAALCEAARIVHAPDARDSLRDIHQALVRAGAVGDAELVVRRCAVSASGDLASAGAVASEAPVFATLDARRRGQVDGAARLRELDRGRLVRAQGEPATRAWIVRSGSIRLYRVGPDGRELTIDVVGPGGMVDEESILAGEGAIDLLAEAREPSSLWGIDAEVLRELARLEPEVGLALGSIVARRARHARELAEEVAFWPVERRVARLLCRLDDQFGHPSLGGGRILSKVFTQEDLAIMVGAGRPSVSLVINELKRQELLDIRKRRLVLLDRDELERRLCSDAA